MKSSFLKGDELEQKVFEILCTEVESDRFLFKREACKVHRKKGYFSKDRESNIFFDVSVEVSYPNAKDYSIVYLIECKNYGHPVGVDELEEFYSKVDQVAAANSKAVFVTTNSFQSGARTFAKSKGIGLARYVEPHELKWELYRSPSAVTSSAGGLFANEVETILNVESYKGRLFDFALSSSRRSTNSLWDFFEDLLQDSDQELDQIASLLNGRSKLDPLVPYITQEQIEDLASRVLKSQRNGETVVNLDSIASQIPGLTVTRLDEERGKIFGAAAFDKAEIVLYRDPEHNRRRFTYAHEISHFLLDHGRFMRRDICEESDITTLKVGRMLPSEVRRMEYQANLLASCILMPRQSFIYSFMHVARELDLQDRGFGYLYYDQQPCNVQDFMLATGALMRSFHVSRSAARIRLETLGLLTNAQAAQRVI